ncbi:hypothetical protein RBB50_010781 [Rhinocladiella similis]
MSAQKALAESYQHGQSWIESLSKDRGPAYRAYLYGYHISHSPSPLFHNTLWKSDLLKVDFRLFDSLDQAGFLQCMKSVDSIGASVTIPHKISAMALVDELTEEARMIGSINTIYIRCDNIGTPRYIGANTDHIGIREAFTHPFPDILETVGGAAGVIVGGGGTTRAAIYTLWKSFGVRHIYLVNRYGSEVSPIVAAMQAAGYDGELRFVENPEEVAICKKPAIIIGTVPDIPPQTQEEVRARRVTESFLATLDCKRGYIGFLLDMCYHPNPETFLMKAGSHHGWHTISGIEALVHQGVVQNALWMERVPNNSAVEAAMSAARRKLGVDFKLL